MDKQEYSSIIKKAPYHIFIFSTRPSFPINFAKHTYVVLVTPKFTHRREVHCAQWKDSKNHEGYLHLNYQKPWEGRFSFLLSSKIKFKTKFPSKLLFHLCGDQKIKKLISKIEGQIKEYPYKNIYHLLGINSNSFIKRLIHENRELKLTLPWNAFGKKNFTD